MVPITQAYIKKGRIPIQVFPVPNAYTNSFVVCSCIFTFTHSKRIGVRTRDRKYLNRYTPFLDVSLCVLGE